MTQRISFTRQMILDAAFELTREAGWPAVTTRSIAKKLGSSTMPIYSSLKSMEEIEREVRAAAEKLMIEYQQKAYTDNAPLNGAIGYVTFARNERNLFRFLYVDRPVLAQRERAGTSGQAEENWGDARGRPDVSLEDITTGRAIASLANQVPVAMQDPRILKSWIFTHGLASMVSSGVLDLPAERIRNLLLEAGAAFFAFEASIKGGGDE